MARQRVILWREAIRDSDCLSANAKLVAYTLSTRMRADGTNAFPSLDRIGAEAHRSRKRVIAAINELEFQCYLQVERGGGRRHPNVYSATFPEEWSDTEQWSSTEETVGEWDWNGVEDAA